MRFALATLLALVPTAFGTITIVGPSPSSFWVANTSNVITWTFSAGDPSPVNIVVVNSDNTTLNGPFFIQNNVDLSNLTFTVTNVTLKTGQNYQVEFLNPLNSSQVFAQSQDFSVMPGGTAPAPTSSVAPSPTGSSSVSGSSTGSSSASSSSSSTSGSPSPSPSNSAASHLTVSGVLGFAVACGAAALAAF